MREQIQNTRKRLYDLVGGEKSFLNTEINRKNLATAGRVVEGTAKDLSPIVTDTLKYGLGTAFASGLVGGLMEGIRIGNAMTSLSPLPEDFLVAYTGIGLGAVIGITSGLGIGIYESVNKFRS